MTSHTTVCERWSLFTQLSFSRLCWTCDKIEISETWNTGVSSVVPMQHPPAVNIRPVSAYYCWTAAERPPPPQHTFMTSLSVMSSGKRLSEHVWRSTPYRNEKWEWPPPCRFSISPPTNLWLQKRSYDQVLFKQNTHFSILICMTTFFVFSIDYYRPENKPHCPWTDPHLWILTLIFHWHFYISLELVCCF